MGKFFKDNWIYIVLPIVLVLAAVLLLKFLGDGKTPGGDGGYNIGALPSLGQFQA
ncbi:MAG: hypothetical protein R3F17_05430 [Planctomycetota bacterium]